MNNFNREIVGFKINNVYCTNTDNLLFQKKHWDVLDKAKLVGENLCQGEKDCLNGYSFYCFFLSLRKTCPTKDEYGIIEEHKTFEGFMDSQILLDRNQHFEILKGNKSHVKLALRWKKGFHSGFVIPKKVR